jgi:hypothetical protein
MRIVSRYSRALLIIEIFALGLSWPTVVGGALVKTVFANGSVAGRATIAGTVLNLLGATIGIWWVWGRLPMRPRQWIWHSIAIATPLSVMWLAVATFYDSAGAVAILFKAMLGGVFYAGPVGVAVGLLVGGVQAGVMRLAGLDEGGDDTRGATRVTVVLLLSAVLFFLLAYSLARVLMAPWWCGLL